MRRISYFCKLGVPLIHRWTKFDRAAARDALSSLTILITLALSMTLPPKLQLITSSRDTRTCGGLVPAWCPSGAVWSNSAQSNMTRTKEINFGPIRSTVRGSLTSYNVSTNGPSRNSQVSSTLLGYSTAPHDVDL